jgi:flagellar FliL protein
MADKGKKKDEEEEETEAEEAEEEGGEEEGGPAKPGSKKKVLIIVVAAVLLVIGGVAAAYFTGLMQPLINMIAGKPASPEAPKAVAAGEAVFIDLPEILVNLNTGGRGRATFLKMRVSLELQRKEDTPVVEKLMPRIVDNFQVYLRELRIEDLKGSAGMYRLREELLTRVVAAAAPAKVNDVLFKEMLVQ